MRSSLFRAWPALCVAALPLVAWNAGPLISGPLLLGQGAPRNAPQRPFAELSSRGSARIFYWGGDHSGGQVELHYGQPAWKPEHEKAIESLAGVRWRLGQNFWTTLDSNMDLAFGETEVLAGCWYLALEKRKSDGAFVLWVLDPVEVRDAHLDAYQVQKTTGGTPIVMSHKTAATTADKLAIRLDVDPQRKDGANLVIHYGPHELTAPLTMAPKRD